MELKISIQEDDTMKCDSCKGTEVFLNEDGWTECSVCGFMSKKLSNGLINTRYNYRTDTEALINFSKIEMIKND